MLAGLWQGPLTAVGGPNTRGRLDLVRMGQRALGAKRSENGKGFAFVSFIRLRYLTILSTGRNLHAWWSEPANVFRGK